MRVIRVLRPVPESAAAARQFVRRTLGSWGCDWLADDAGVVVSELVTNVVLHARTSAVVNLDFGRGRVRLSVADAAPITARVGAAAQVGEPDEGRGNGLLLVRELSDQWGVDSDREHKVVWAEWQLESVPAGSLSGS